MSKHRRFHDIRERNNEYITVYNPSTLKKLKYLNIRLWMSFKNKHKDEWITKDKLPCYRELVEFSCHYNIPFGYLFVDRVSIFRLIKLIYFTRWPNDSQKS